MAVTYVNPQIDAGSAVSDVVDCTAATPVRFYMPTNWEGDTITFQVSADGHIFYDLYDANGAEVSVTVFGRVAVDIKNGPKAGEYFKIRSGTAQNPIDQDVPRIFTVVLLA